MAAALSLAESSRVSVGADEKTEPRPCTRTRAVRGRRFGSVTTPSSQTPSRVLRRTSDTGTPTGRGMVGHSLHSGRRSSDGPLTALSPRPHPPAMAIQPSKAQLLEALAASRDEVVALMRSVPLERLEEGRYENGWNGRQILAHIASIEWTYPRLIDIARTPPVEEATPPTRAMKGGNDAYNDRQVSKRAHLTVPELLAEFAANRAATIKAVEAADEALFARPIRSAGGVVGPLALVFHQVAVAHVLGHARDIAGGS